MKEYTLGEWLEIWLLHYVEPSGLAVHTKMCYNRAVQAVPAELSLVDMKFLSPLDCLRRQPLTLSGLFCEASPNRVYRAHRALLERLQLPAVTLHGCGIPSLLRLF